jgi:plasmid stabilization system protein ParE
LIDIWRYVAQHNEAAADRLYARFHEVAQRLADYPQSQREQNELGSGTRIAPLHRFLICYREVESGVEIFRVIHAARDIGRVLRDDSS